MLMSGSFQNNYYLAILYTMSSDAFLQSLFKTELSKPMELAADLEVRTTRIGRDRQSS